MNCLHCQKPIGDMASDEEIKYSWHNRCIKKFFGKNKFPDIDSSEEMLMQMVLYNSKKGYTIPGVQKKISLNLTKDDSNPRLTLMNHPAGFILKPQTKEYPNLPESEYLVMQMAVVTGIKTVPFALVKTPGNESSFAYITRRIDRVLNKTNQIEMLAMEDFCQLDGRLTQDKYRGSYELCAKLITKYSIRSGFDLSELFLRIVFSYVIGNSDMHLKNFSLIETSCNSKEYVLADAYDLIPANVIIPKDTEQFALTLNGRKTNIKSNDFYIFAKTIGVPEKSAEKMIRKVVFMEDEYIFMCADSFISKVMKNRIENLIHNRITVLKSG